MKTIYVKFLVLIGCFILASLLALGIISFKAASRALQENSRKQYEQLVQNSQEKVDEKLRERLNQIQFILDSSNLALFADSLEVSSRPTLDSEVYALQKVNSLTLEPPKAEGDLLNFGIMWVHPGNQKIKDLGLYPSEEYVGLDGVVKQHVYGGGSNDEDFVTGDSTKLDRSKEVWFQEAKRGNLYISEPQPVKLYLKEYKPSQGIYPEKVVERNLIVLAMPYKVQDQVRGVLMVTTTPDFLYHEVERLKPGSGQAFILNSKGKALAHTDGSLLGTFPKGVEVILGQSAGWAKYLDNLVIYRRSHVADWIVGIYVPEKEILAATYTLRSRTIWIILITLIVVGVVVTLFTRKLIISPLKEMVSFAETIQEGDLTRTLPGRTEDEIGRLGKTLNAMLATVRTATARIRESSNQLNMTAEELHDHSITLSTGSDGQYVSVEKISMSVQQLDQSIKGLSKDAENLSSAAEETSASMLEMKAALEEVTGVMEDLSSSVNETASSIEQMMVSIKHVADNTGRLSSEAESTYLAIDKIHTSIQEVSSNVEYSRKLSEETTQAALEGQRSMGETLQGMQGIKEVVLRSAEVIQNLGNRTEEIGAILDVINDIAEQTSLLALNASIIAAQAGEHGRGFAVVAEEVRELAHRSTLSAKEIGNLIKNVQKEATNAIQAMRDGVKKVEDGVRLADRTGELLKQILGRAEKSAATVSEITKATHQQAENGQRIVQYMENVNRMISEITKAMDEQQKGSNQIMVAVENMRNLADQVKHALSEQTKGTNQVNHAMETVMDIALRIKNISIEQTRDATQIIRSIEAIKEVIEENLQAIKKSRQVANNLLEHSRNLREAVGTFKIE